MKFAFSLVIASMALVSNLGFAEAPFAGAANAAKFLTEEFDKALNLNKGAVDLPSIDALDLPILSVADCDWLNVKANTILTVYARPDAIQLIGRSEDGMKRVSVIGVTIPQGAEYSADKKVVNTHGDTGFSIEFVPETFSIVAHNKFEEGVSCEFKVESCAFFGGCGFRK